MIEEAKSKAMAKQKELEGEYSVDTDGRAALAEIDDQVMAEVNAAKELLEGELNDALNEQVAVMEEPIEQLKDELETLKSDLQDELDDLNSQLEA